MPPEKSGLNLRLSAAALYLAGLYSNVVGFRETAEPGVRWGQPEVRWSQPEIRWSQSFGRARTSVVQEFNARLGDYIIRTLGRRRLNAKMAIGFKPSTAPTTRTMMTTHSLPVLMSFILTR